MNELENLIPIASRCPRGDDDIPGKLCELFLEGNPIAFRPGYRRLAMEVLFGRDTVEDRCVSVHQAWRYL